MSRTVSFPALVSSIVLLSFCNSPLFAGGYKIDEHSPATAGRANAVVARLDDPSCIFSNPGGLGYQKGLRLLVQTQFILPKFSYSDPEGLRESAKLTNKLIVLPSVFFSHSFGPRDEWAAGLGIFAPFGLKLDYPEGWAGDKIVKSIDLQTIYFSPSIAYRPIKQISIGVSFNFILARVELHRNLGLPDSKGNIGGSVGMGGRTFAFNATFGIQARPIKDLYLGFTYKTQGYISASGNADFDVPLAYKSGLQDQKISTKLFLPDVLTLGVGYQIIPQLYLEADFEYTFWSIVRAIVIRFDKPLNGTIDHETLHQEWRNSWTARLGAVIKATDFLTFRAGFAYDRNPVPDSTLSPVLPDSDRVVFSLGIGYVHKKSGVFIDVSYLGAIFRKRTVSTADSVDSFPQTYSNQAHLIGVGIGLRR